MLVEVGSGASMQSFSLVQPVGRTVRACVKTSGGILRLGVGKRARVPGCKYMHYILENVSLAARMEGNYSMTLKMGLGYMGAGAREPSRASSISTQHDPLFGY